MTRDLRIHVRRRSFRVDARFLRTAAVATLDRFWPSYSYELGVALIGPRSMAALNRRFLNHEGPTDVITFDYNETRAPYRLHGEAFICLDVARRQAEAFATSWPEETLRYVVHAFLHLDGHDDRAPDDRRRMKREEDRLMTWIKRRFDLSRLERHRAS